MQGREQDSDASKKQPQQGKAFAFQTIGPERYSLLITLEKQVSQCQGVQDEVIKAGKLAVDLLKDQGTSCRLSAVPPASRYPLPVPSGSRVTSVRQSWKGPVATRPAGENRLSPTSCLHLPLPRLGFQALFRAAWQLPTPMSGGQGCPRPQALLALERSLYLPC